MRRRDLDGCPIAGALQVIGDNWTMLIFGSGARAAAHDGASYESATDQ